MTALPQKIAIVHDWLTVRGGAERVLERLLLRFPQADLFALVDFLPEAERDCILHKPVRTSFIQRLPFARRHYRQYLPLMPIAIEQFDLSAYDLVISSSHAVAKGVLTGPDQLHLCLCYSPMRYAWDLQHQYLRESGLERGLKGLLARWMLHRLRLWDVRSANGVDAFIAISGFIANRIRKTYRRESRVIYPPVDTLRFVPGETRGETYLTVSRLVPYKRIDLIIKAFAALPERQLVVIGDGPERARLQALAPPNVTLLGHQPEAAVLQHMQQARAFLFAAEEDFGIVALEAQACGTPVIAYGRGGALETVRGQDDAQPTGRFFYEQTAEALVGALRAFESEAGRYTPAACREQAERFSQTHFDAEFGAFVDAAWQTHRQRNTRGGII